MVKTATATTRQDYRFCASALGLSKVTCSFGGWFWGALMMSHLEVHARVSSICRGGSAHVRATLEVLGSDFTWSHGLFTHEGVP